MGNLIKTNTKKKSIKIRRRHKGSCFKKFEIRFFTSLITMSWQLNQSRAPMPYLTRSQIEQIRAGADAEIARLRAEIAGLQEQRDQLQRTVDDLQSRNLQLNNQIQTLNAQITNLQQQIQTLNGQITNLQQQLQSIAPLWNVLTSFTTDTTLSNSYDGIYGIWMNANGTWSNRSVISYTVQGSNTYQYITLSGVASIYGTWKPFGTLYIMTSTGQEYEIPNVTSVRLTYSPTYERYCIYQTYRQ